ncbi:MAG: Crp/Fnr family transcriptional regulator [Bacteroidota bacterium]
MEALATYLREAGKLAESDIAAFLELGQLKTFQKGDYLIREGQICQEAGFVQSGIFRSFYFTQNSEEVTYCFTFAPNLISAYSSYITGRPSPENIQALTEAEVWLFPKTGLEALMAQNPAWLWFSKHLAEQQYLEMEQRIFLLQKESAETRYAHLQREQPQLLQHIPLQYLASYLGITQRHLSRLRKA